MGTAEPHQDTRAAKGRPYRSLSAGPIGPCQYGCTPTGAAGGGPYPSAMR